MELAAWLKTAPRPLLERALYLGARERVAVRLSVARVPTAVINDRRRCLRRNAKKRGSPPSQAHLTLLAGTLFMTNGPEPGWTPGTVCRAYACSWQVELVFKSWKRHRHLAPFTTKTAERTLCYRYGRMLLMLLNSALCPALRAT